MGQCVLYTSDVCGRAFSWVTLTSPWDRTGPLQRAQGWTQGEANSDEGLGHCCPPVSSVAIQGGAGCGLRCDSGARRRLSVGLRQLCNGLSSGSEGKTVSLVRSALLGSSCLVITSNLSPGQYYFPLRRILKPSLTGLSQALGDRDSHQSLYL